MSRMSKAGNILMALIFLVAGILMITGLLDWVIRVVGVVSLLVAVYFAYQAFRGKRRRNPIP